MMENQIFGAEALKSEKASLLGKPFQDCLLFEVQLFDDFDLIGIVGGQVVMEDVVHPQPGVDIRQVLDKLPDKVKLGLPVDEAEEEQN